MRDTTAIRRRLGVVVLGLGLVACDGVIDDPWGTDPAPGLGGDDPIMADGGVDTALCEGTCLGTSHLTRMLRVQYTATVRDLLGTTAPGELLPADGTAGPFAANGESPLDAFGVDSYRLAAEAAAAGALPDTMTREELAAFVGCDFASGARECGTSWIDSFGRRVYRRSLLEEEHAAYVELLDWACADGDCTDAGTFRAAIRLLVETFLQSPRFLYRIEVGAPTDDDPAVVALSSAEIASRLAHLILRGQPDAPLLDAADDPAALDSPEEVEAEARRLLALPAAERMIRQFHTQWLDIAFVDRAVFTPGVSEDGLDYSLAFTPALGDDMVEETQRFALHVLREGDGRLETLLAGDYTILSPALEEHYGIARPAVGDWVVTPLPPERRGMLMHGSVLTAHQRTSRTRPIFRGKLVRERLLCQEMPPPDPLALAEAASFTYPDASQREQLEALTTDEGRGACSGCHSVMNPLGFAFDTFDSLGRARTTIRGGTTPRDFPIDPSGELGGAADADGPFADARDLVERLAASETVARCMTRQWFRFALGREESAADDAALDQAYAAFQSADLDMRELIVAITRTDAFRHRRVQAP